MIVVPADRIAEYTARGWWRDVTLHDLFAGHVAARPDAEAVVDASNRAEFAPGAPRRLSWRQLADEVDRFGRLLLDAGIRRDDVLVMQMPNGVEQFVVYLACARLGIIVSPVPIQYREHELRHVLEATRAVAASTFGRIGRAAAPHDGVAMFGRLAAVGQSCGGAQAPHLKTIFDWGGAAPAAGGGAPRAAGAASRRAGTGPAAEVTVVPVVAGLAAPLSPADRDRLAAAITAAAVTANDVFTICWTSGTEAQPKGVPRSHNEWLIVAPSIIEAAELQPGARLLNPFPLVNMAGLSTAFATWLTLGGTVMQHQPFSLPAFLAQLREEAIDYTVAAPAILNALLQNAALLDGIDFGRLSRIGSGSAPLSDWMVRGFAERYGVRIVNYFGSNEGAALSGSYRDIPDHELRARFFPRAGVDGFDWQVSTLRKIRTRLVDIETGAIIDQPGHPGELRFRGPTIFSGYYRAPELTARAFDEDGYYKSGDLFEIAGERGEYYRYVGRSKDLVIRGGVNISSEEIENLLLACPGVKEAAVVGVPDQRLGERVCACVVADAAVVPTLAAINAFLANELRIAIYKLPEYLMLLDALPRNPVGKILKRDLRTLAGQRAERGELVREHVGRGE
ncbi:MAG: class I adenylate-forming enzyme family protein [Lautropia sp.]